MQRPASADVESEIKGDKNATKGIHSQPHSLSTFFSNLIQTLRYRDEVNVKTSK